MVTMMTMMTMMTMITMLTMMAMMAIMIMRKDNDDYADFTDDDRRARLHTLSLNSCTELANQARRDTHYCAAGNYRDYRDDNYEE